MLKGSVLTVALAVAVTGGTARAQEDGSACDRTTYAARKACKNEVRDDFWTTVGNCRNVSAADEREQCLADAETARVEGAAECGDQRDAREELCLAIGQSRYDPVIDPLNFLLPAVAAANPNPLFPLVPGREWVYEGPDGETVTVTVTSETKVILGVTTFVVRDVERDENGDVVEDTFDWFAQDTAGNVWYFGEISQEFEDGELTSIDGSWKAGVDRAKPGIIMKGAPAVGDVYRQEFALGDAEDAAEVTSTTGTESTPGGSCTGNCLVTRDFSPLEPDAEENKFYAPGIGLILEIDTASGERVELISVTN